MTEATSNKVAVQFVADFDSAGAEAKLTQLLSNLKQQAAGFTSLMEKMLSGSKESKKGGSGKSSPSFIDEKELKGQVKELQNNLTKIKGIWKNFEEETSGGTTRKPKGVRIGPDKIQRGTTQHPNKESYDKAVLGEDESKGTVKNLGLVSIGLQRVEADTQGWKDKVIGFYGVEAMRMRYVARDIYRISQAYDQLGAGVNKVFKLMSTSSLALEGSLTDITWIFEDMGASIGDAFAPIVEKVLPLLEWVSDVIDNLSEPIKILLALVVVGALAFTIFASGILKVVSNFNLLRFGLIDVFARMKRTGTEAKGLEKTMIGIGMTVSKPLIFALGLNKALEQSEMEVAFIESMTDHFYKLKATANGAFDVGGDPLSDLAKDNDPAGQWFAAWRSVNKEISKGPKAQWTVPDFANPKVVQFTEALETSMQKTLKCTKEIARQKAFEKLGSGVFNKELTDLAEIPKKGEGAFGGLFDWIKKHGKGILSGLVGGGIFLASISQLDVMTDLMQQIGDIANSIADKFGWLFEIIGGVLDWLAQIADSGPIGAAIIAMVAAVAFYFLIMKGHLKDIIGIAVKFIPALFSHKAADSFKKDVKNLTGYKTAAEKAAAAQAKLNDEKLNGPKQGLIGQIKDKFGKVKKGAANAPAPGAYRFLKRTAQHKTKAEQENLELSRLQKQRLNIIGKELLKEEKLKEKFQAYGKETKDWRAKNKVTSEGKNSENAQFTVPEGVYKESLERQKNMKKIQEQLSKQKLRTKEVFKENPKFDRNSPLQNEAAERIWKNIQDQIDRTTDTDPKTIKDKADASKNLEEQMAKYKAANPIAYPSKAPEVDPRQFELNDLLAQLKTLNKHPMKGPNIYGQIKTDSDWLKKVKSLEEQIAALRQSMKAPIAGNAPVVDANISAIMENTKALMDLSTKFKMLTDDRGKYTPNPSSPEGGAAKVQGTVTNANDGKDYTVKTKRGKSIKQKLDETVLPMVKDLEAQQATMKIASTAISDPLEKIAKQYEAIMIKNEAIVEKIAAPEEFIPKVPAVIEEVKTKQKRHREPKKQKALYEKIMELQDLTKHPELLGKLGSGRAISAELYGLAFKQNEETGKMEKRSDFKEPKNYNLYNKKTKKQFSGEYIDRITDKFGSGTNIAQHNTKAEARHKKKTDSDWRRHNPLNSEEYNTAAYQMDMKEVKAKAIDEGGNSKKTLGLKMLTIMRKIDGASVTLLHHGEETAEAWAKTVKLAEQYLGFNSKSMKLAADPGIINRELNDLYTKTGGKEGAAVTNPPMKEVEVLRKSSGKWYKKLINLWGAGGKISGQIERVLHGWVQTGIEANLESVTKQLKGGKAAMITNPDLFAKTTTQVTKNVIESQNTRSNVGKHYAFTDEETETWQNNKLDAAGILNFLPNKNKPNKPKVAAAYGTIVNQPTKALIGEDGPEAVVPLSPEKQGAANKIKDMAKGYLENKYKSITDKTAPNLPHFGKGTVVDSEKQGAANKIKEMAINYLKNKYKAFKEKQEKHKDLAASSEDISKYAGSGVSDTGSAVENIKANTKNAASTELPKTKEPFKKNNKEAKGNLKIMEELPGCYENMKSKTLSLTGDLTKLSVKENKVGIKSKIMDVMHKRNKISMKGMAKGAMLLGGGILGLLGASGALQPIMEAFEPIFMALSDLLQPIADAIQPLVDQIADWMDKNPELAGGILILVVALAGLFYALANSGIITTVVTAFTSMSPVIIPLIAAIITFALVFMFLKDKIGTLPALIGALFAAILVGVGVFKLMATVLPKVGTSIAKVGQPIGAAIKAIGQAATQNAVGILALGVACILVAAAIWIIAQAISVIVGSFANFLAITSATLGPGNAMNAMFALIAAGIAVFVIAIIALIVLAAPLTVAILAIGIAGTAGALGFLAIGAAAIMIGAGIWLVAQGFSAVLNSLTMLLVVLPGVATSAPGIMVLALALGAVALAGLALIPAAFGIAAFSLAITGAGIAIAAFGFFAGGAFKDIANNFQKIGDAASNISNAIGQSVALTTNIMSLAGAYTTAANAALMFNKAVNSGPNANASLSSNTNTGYSGPKTITDNSKIEININGLYDASTEQKIKDIIKKALNEITTNRGKY